MELIRDICFTSRLFKSKLLKFSVTLLELKYSVCSENCCSYGLDRECHKKSKCDLKA